MQAGPRDHRLRFEAKQVTQETTSGTDVVTWATFATTWGSVQDVLPGKSSEGAENGIRIAERVSRVRILWTPGVTSDMRIVDTTDSNRIMKILSPPAMVGRKEGMQMMASDFSTAGEVA